MTSNFQRVSESKRAYRRKLGNLPPAEKLRILEEIRARAQIRQGSRQSPLPKKPTVAIDIEQDSQLKKPAKKRKVGLPRTQESPHRFGGRATAGGVNYEVRVAAFIAVKMLAGSQCSVWNGINGADLSAITMQASEPVDDIVVSLRGDKDSCVFISAKQRSGTIALTKRSPAFTDTINAFVEQFLKLSVLARSKSRLVWAVSAGVGRAITHELLDVLETHRRDAGDTTLSAFLRDRQPRKKEALKVLLTLAAKAWIKQTGNSPTDDDLRDFLRLLHVEVYDFACGQRFERQAESDIRSYIVTDSKRANNVWEKLEHFFTDANQRGVRITPASLRKVLVADGLTLKSPPDYAGDIARLSQLTTRNLASLKEHATLRFGPNPSDIVHIPRTEELSSLLAAVKSNHLLITGEPGCGKSGLIHQLVETLQNDRLPVVLLLAEEVFGRDWKASANLPGFIHALDEMLANWPNGERGFLITDALDAVRDVETQKMLRLLLRDVQQGQSGWTVVASVREYDLQFGRELREAFRGAGVVGHAANTFTGVTHFYLTRLSEPQLDDLATKRIEIRPFIESARNSPKSDGIHRSPFYLRLAAELLRDGENPLRLADWNSPAVLLRKFWETRIEGGSGAAERQVALETICRRMVDIRSMTISLKELSLNASERTSVSELRSRGILQAPALLRGTNVGGDEIRYTHHLLYDYAIARSLIPETPVTFCDFAIREPLLPVLYRQSFLFALEELWDAPDNRKGFWEAALKLESVPNLHSLTRILAPILAARRVESLIDLAPLLTALESSDVGNSPAQKALQHTASGLQDARDDAIRAGATGWCAFAEQLARLLPMNTAIEIPLVHILAQLNKVKAAIDAKQCFALNAAGRGLLTCYAAKELSKSWPYIASVAIETVCRTFSTANAESEKALLALLAPERLKQFPHRDLHSLADNLRYLGADGNTVVLTLFKAAFSMPGPAPGEYEESGSAILSFSLQTSDSWNSVRYALSMYYEAQKGEDAALMTEIACIVWNSVVGQRERRSILGTIQFRGVPCELVEDYSHISGREYKYNENRILSHFEKMLRSWAAANDTVKLNHALNRFAVCNHTSLIWTVILAIGAEYPLTLGLLLECVLNEPLFLTHLDYSYGGTALLAALHTAGDAAQRERLEKLILDLPKNTLRRDRESSDEMRYRVEYAQSRLLGVLEEANIVLDEVRDLRRERQAKNSLPANQKPTGPQVISHQYSREELLEQRGIDLKKSENCELFRLREALSTFLNLNNNKIDVGEVERNWAVIQQSERAFDRYANQSPAMAEELWGHLVSACENIASNITSWPKTSERWKTIRRILLKASTSVMPQGDNDKDTKEEGWPSWGWPAPRLDAARGLPFLAHRVGFADKAVSAALRRLCRDKSIPLRFNLAERLAVLEQPSSRLMWEMMDTFIANENRFSVLDALTMSMDRLWQSAPEKVRPRLRRIADRALQGATADNHIFETIAHSHLFHFLRTGDLESWTYTVSLIGECDHQRASGALLPLLHACRAGGWLTAGDEVKPNVFADEARKRTWSFFSTLLTTAQTKLQLYRETSEQLHKCGQPDAEAIKLNKENMVRTMHLVDSVAMQLYFASGAFDDKSNTEKVALSQAQLQRFWREAAQLFAALGKEPHPHTANQIVETLCHLLPCAPRDIFLLAAKTICNSAKQARYQYEALAVGEVVKLIQRVLADHRDVFESATDQESECLKALLEVLDLFVEAGWPEARQLTNRLEEINR